MLQTKVQTDIAGKGHWDDIYHAKDVAQPQWSPYRYGELAIGHALLRAIEHLQPRSLLEVGCGDSTWLPYLARKTGARVTGMDYSEEGCELARRHLQASEVTGEILCADLQKADPKMTGQFDFVYSLGLVEHFSDLEGILGDLLKFVRPGGMLFTEVPNLRSIHGLIVWLWQPQLMAKHELISRRRLARAYESLSLENISAHYLGLFSLEIPAWEIYARWPRLVPVVVPRVRRLSDFIDPRLGHLGRFGGIMPLAPYVYAVGRKPLMEKKLSGSTD